MGVHRDRVDEHHARGFPAATDLRGPRVRCGIRRTCPVWRILDPLWRSPQRYLGLPRRSLDERDLRRLPLAAVLCRVRGGPDERGGPAVRWIPERHPRPGIEPDVDLERLGVARPTGPARSPADLGWGDRLRFRRPTGGRLRGLERSRWRRRPLQPDMDVRERGVDQPNDRGPRSSDWGVDGRLSHPRGGGPLRRDERLRAGDDVQRHLGVPQQRMVAGPRRRGAGFPRFRGVRLGHRDRRRRPRRGTWPPRRGRLGVSPGHMDVPRRRVERGPRELHPGRPRWGRVRPGRGCRRERSAVRGDQRDGGVRERFVVVHPRHLGRAPRPGRAAGTNRIDVRLGPGRWLRRPVRRVKQNGGVQRHLVVLFGTMDGPIRPRGPPTPARRCVRVRPGDRRGPPLRRPERLEPDAERHVDLPRRDLDGDVPDGGPPGQGLRHRRLRSCAARRGRVRRGVEREHADTPSPERYVAVHERHVDPTLDSRRAEPPIRFDDGIRPATPVARAVWRLDVPEQPVRRQRHLDLRSERMAAVRCPRRPAAGRVCCHVVGPDDERDVDVRGGGAEPHELHGEPFVRHARPRPPRIQRDALRERRVDPVPVELLRLRAGRGCAVPGTRGAFPARPDRAQAAPTRSTPREPTWSGST